jgi:hypothetical protein
LEDLDLAYTVVDDEMFSYLADCECLGFLDLTGTKVTPAAIGEFQERLPECIIDTDEDGDEQA